MQASAQHDDNSSSLLSSGEQNFAHVAAPPDRYPYPNVDQPNTDLGDLIFHGGGLSAEEKKEILVVARNSIEILSSILNSETKERPFEVC